jgi:hypothetical protein
VSLKNWSVEKLCIKLWNLQRVGELFCKVNLKSFARWLIKVSLLLTFKILSIPNEESTYMLGVRITIFSLYPFCKSNLLESFCLFKVRTSKVRLTWSLMYPESDASKLWSFIIWWRQSLMLQSLKFRFWCNIIFRVHILASNFSWMVYLLFYTFNAYVNFIY